MFDHSHAGILLFRSLDQAGVPEERERGRDRATWVITRPEERSCVGSGQKMDPRAFNLPNKSPSRPCSPSANEQFCVQKPFPRSKGTFRRRKWPPTCASRVAGSRGTKWWNWALRLEVVAPSFFSGRCLPSSESSIHTAIYGLHYSSARNNFLLICHFKTKGLPLPGLRI